MVAALRSFSAALACAASNPKKLTSRHSLISWGPQWHIGSPLSPFSASQVSTVVRVPLSQAYSFSFPQAMHRQVSSPSAGPEQVSSQMLPSQSSIAPCMLRHKKKFL